MQSTVSISMKEHKRRAIMKAAAVILAVANPKKQYLFAGPSRIFPIPHLTDIHRYLMETCISRPKKDLPNAPFATLLRAIEREFGISFYVDRD